MHYHTCKHAIALGLHFCEVTVPDRYSLEVTAYPSSNPQP